MANNFLNITDNALMPLGGIGTGSIYLSKSAKIQKLCLSEKDNDTFLADAFFVITANDSEHSSVILQAEKQDGLDLPIMQDASISQRFPFIDIEYKTSSFPASIKCSSYSPFKPLDSVDSGIPCAIFDFTIENTKDIPLEYSIYFAVKHNFEQAQCFAGCSDSGEAHILMNDAHGNNMCISTNEKFVSFGVNFLDFKEFDESTFSDNIEKTNAEGKLNVLCASFKVDDKACKNISFCYSWYFPECCLRGIHFKNYYAKYFESSAECAEYVFSHKDRLFCEADTFCKSIFSSNLSENALFEVNNSLQNLRIEHFKRTDNGALICSLDTYEPFCDLDLWMNRASALYTLFPELDYSFTNLLYKKGSDDYGRIDLSLLSNINTAKFSEKQGLYLQLICILKSYRYYIHTDNLTEIIENWYYISRCIDYFFTDENPNAPDKDASGILGDSSLQPIYSAALYCAYELAKAVKDKNRVELYYKLYQSSRNFQNSLSLCQGFGFLNEESGFEYNAVEKSIGFKPKSDNCDFISGDNFRCFFCTPQCYGYVEEGVDYIEINILYGTLTLRRFEVPRKPRLVQYGGRNWNFKDTGLCALLDCDLEITSSKKLTILIDIK